MVVRIIPLVLSLCILFTTYHLVGKIRFSDKEAIAQWSRFYEKSIQLEQEASFSKALNFAVRAFEVCENSLPPDHPHTFMTLCRLGHLEAELYRFDESEKHLSRALKITRKRSNPDFAEIGRCEYLKGQLSAIREDTELAIHHYESALSYYKKCAPCGVHLAKTMVGLALVLHQTGKTKEAEDNCLHATELLGSAKQSKSKTAADCLRLLGHMKQEQGICESAKEYCEGALAIYDELNIQGIDCAKCMISLALVHEKQDDISRAETMLLRALEIVQRAYGPKHKEVKKCRALIKSFYEKQNMVNKLASLSN